jgi:hypothetical protein
MKTPREKYMNDPEYKRLVQTLEHMIHTAQFTPSELREACILASINYEMRHIRQSNIPARVEDALQILDRWTGEKSRRKL